MKYIVTILVLFIVSPTFPQELADTQFAKKTSANAMKSMEELNRLLKLLENNKDQEKDADLTIDVLKATSCMQSYMKDMDEATMKKYFESLKKKKILDDKMAKMIGDGKFLKKLMPLRGQVISDPKSLCTFVEEKSADEIKKEKMEKDNAEKSLTAILSIKKQVHPAIAKLISDLEDKKEKLKQPATEPVELKTGEYERNFIKVYDFQCRYINSKSLQKISILSSDCISKIKSLFVSKCNGKPRFSLVKGQYTQLLLCADDNLTAIGPACGYTRTFNETI